MPSQPDHPLNALPRGHGLQEYRIESVLGAGGFGITYLAADGFGRPVAIKEYLPNDLAVRVGGSTRVGVRSTDASDDYEWGLRKFREEGAKLAAFKHPNINQVLRYFEDNGTAYLVLEYVRGRTLSQVLADGPMDREGLRRLLDELLQALQVVHGAGLVHCDIKPSNIVLRDDDGVAVLLDFGASRQAVTNRTRSVAAAFTPPYAAIEQYESESPHLGPWTDLYALAMVAYRCVSSKKEAELPDAVRRSRYKHKDETHLDMKPASEVGQGRHDSSLLQAIDWGLQVEERERPQSALEMAGAAEIARPEEAGRGDPHGSTTARTGDQPPRIPPLASATAVYSDVREAAQPNQAGESCLVAIPSPIMMFWLAVGVVAIGVGIRAAIGKFPMEMWLQQGLLFFPVACWLGTRFVQRIRAKLFRAPRYRGLAVMTLTVVSYLVVSTLSSLLYAIGFALGGELYRYHEEPWNLLLSVLLSAPSSYALLSSEATSEFAAFGLLHVIAYIVAQRKAWLRPRSQGKFLRLANIPMALATCAFLFIAFSQASTTYASALEKDVYRQLLRIGRISKPAKDEKSYGDVARSAMERPGTPLSKAFANELRELPTKTRFVLATSGGDFSSFNEVKEFVDHLATVGGISEHYGGKEKVPVLMIEIKPGRYPLTKSFDVYSLRLLLDGGSHRVKDLKTIALSESRRVDGRRPVIETSGSMSFSRVSLRGLRIEGRSAENPAIELYEVAAEDLDVSKPYKDGIAAVDVRTTDSAATELTNVTIVGGPLVVRGQRAALDTIYVKSEQSAIWALADANISIKDVIAESAQSAIWASGTSQLHLAGAIAQIRPRKTGDLYSAVSLTEKAVLRSSSASIQATAGCLALRDDASADLTDTMFGPCGADAYPIWLAAEGSRRVVLQRPVYVQGSGPSPDQFINKPVDGATVQLTPHLSLK